MIARRSQHQERYRIQLLVVGEEELVVLIVAGGIRATDD